MQQAKLKSFSRAKSAASVGPSSAGGRPPPAIFSTFSPFTQSSETPSRSIQARRASSSGSVEGLSRPAVFISLAARPMLSRHRDTPGMNVSLPIAWALSSAEEAMYFFSTDRLAAAVGFSSTHMAPLSSARVTFAAPAGLLAANLPLTTVAQQYSSR